MELKDWTPPSCPKCGADEMAHKLFSHVPSTRAFREKNGWYCEKCKAGPFKLGNATESDAAQFSLKILNK